MKTIVITNYSAGTSCEELAKITIPQMEMYCQHRGYDFQALQATYDREGHLAILRCIQTMLEKYDIVLTVGCDVVFTNVKIGVEDFCITVDSEGKNKWIHPLTVAKEAISFFPINNDVAIWCDGLGGTKHGMATRIIDRIMMDVDIWIKYPWLHQTHLWNLIQMEQWIKTSVFLADTRRLNSTPFIGASNWQVGDWLVHLLSMPVGKKIELAKEYIKLAGNCDGTYYPPAI